MNEHLVRAPAPLHPDVQAYLASMVQIMERRNLPPLWTVEVKRRRALNKLLIEAGQPPQAPCAIVENIEIPTRTGKRVGRVFRGPALDTGTLPIVVYYHGGGFAIGGISESEHEIRRYATAVPAVVVAIEYSKTPEHPYPVADEDCYDALLWAAEHGRAYGGDIDRIVLAGTSCGACLATSTARRSLERKGPPVALVAAVTPWYDKSMSLPSMRAYASGYHLDWEEVQHYRDLYLPNGAAGVDAYNSPAIFPTIAGMPPHYILAAQCDGVVDEAYAFAEQLKKVGTKCELVEAEGLIHAFTLLSHLIPAANNYLGGLHDAVRRAGLRS
ncbi:MAG: alpha/beta hydrolase [Pseudomonadota bacterium]|jgi:acetyl esterase